MKTLTLILIFITYWFSAYSQNKKSILIRNSEITMDGGLQIIPRTLPLSNDSIDYKYYFISNDTTRLLVVGNSKSSLKNSVSFYKQRFFYKKSDNDIIYEWVKDYVTIKFDKDLKNDIEIMYFLDGLEVEKLEEIEIIWENKW
jgi:hypothetical protein